MYDVFRAFAEDMEKRYKIPAYRADQDLHSVLSDGYSLDNAVDGLIEVYKEEYKKSLLGCEYCDKTNPKIIGEHYHESSLNTFDVTVYSYDFIFCPYCSKKLY